MKLWLKSYLKEAGSGLLLYCSLRPEGDRDALVSPLRAQRERQMELTKPVVEGKDAVVVWRERKKG